MADLEKSLGSFGAYRHRAAELSKMLEEKWGVSAAAPVAVAAAAPGADAGGEAAAEKDAFTVMLTAMVTKRSMSSRKCVRSRTWPQRGEGLGRRRRSRQGRRCER